MINNMINNIVDPLKITLDFYNNETKFIKAKQYDKESRYVLVNCTEKGIPVALDNTTMKCKFKMNTPDNRAIYNDAFILDDGSILIELTESCLIEAGKGQFELDVIYFINEEDSDDNDGRLLSSMNCDVIIEKSVYSNDKIIASDEFNALTNMVTKEEERYNSLKDLEETVEQAEAIRVSNENTRIKNENDRVSAESARETDAATAISNANTATTNANNATKDAIDATTATNTATEAANTATQNANTAIEKMEALMKNDNLVHKSELGVAGGVATLDEDGFLTASQIPDRTIEYYYGTLDKDTQAFTDSEGNIVDGKPNKMYIDITENIPYVWSGIEFVATGSKLGLGYTSSTAFPGSDGLDLQKRTTAIEEYHNNIPASDIKFDNTDTTLLGANVQDVIEELTETATTTKNGLLSAEDKKTIDTYKNIYTYETTLLSAKWTGDSAPYIQILTVSELTGYNNCNIVLSDDATAEQEIAVINADITGISYDESVGLTFTASGEKPTVDIPIVFKFGASMNVSEVPKYLGTLNEGESISFDASTSDDLTSSNIQDAINETNNKIGLLSNLTTGIKTSIVNALNWIVEKLGGNDISAIGDGTVTGAINSLNTDLAANYHWKSYGRVTAIGLTSTCTMDDILVALYKKGNFSMLCTPMWKIDYPNINFATSSNRHILTVKVAESGYVLVSDFDVNTGIEYVCGHDGDNYTAWLSTAAVP